MNTDAHKILIFTEYLCDGFGEPLPGGESYRVSTRKLEDFKINNEFEYGYIEDLIDEAMEGKTDLYTGSKYSFGDCTGWYTALEPDAECDDPEVYISVTVG